VIVDPDSLKEKEIDLTSSSSLDVISNSEVTKDVAMTWGIPLYF
jgi:hypothetical protein